MYTLPMTAPTLTTTTIRMRNLGRRHSKSRRPVSVQEEAQSMPRLRGQSTSSPGKANNARAVPRTSCCRCCSAAPPGGARRQTRQRPGRRATAQGPPFSCAPLKSGHAGWLLEPLQRMARVNAEPLRLVPTASGSKQQHVGASAVTSPQGCRIRILPGRATPALRARQPHARVTGHSRGNSAPRRDTRLQWGLSDKKPRELESLFYPILPGQHARRRQHS